MFVLKFVPSIYDDWTVSNLISWLIMAANQNLQSWLIVNCVRPDHVISPDNFNNKGQIVWIDTSYFDKKIQKSKLMTIYKASIN